MQSRAREAVAAIVGLLPILRWMHKLLIYLSRLEPVGVSWKSEWFFVPSFPARLVWHIGTGWFFMVFLSPLSAPPSVLFIYFYFIFNFFIMSEISKASTLLPSLGLFSDITLTYNGALSERERICQYPSHFSDFLTNLLSWNVVWLYSGLECPKQSTSLQRFLKIRSPGRSFHLDIKNECTNITFLLNFLINMPTWFCRKSIPSFVAWLPLRGHWYYHLGEARCKPINGINL